MNSPEETLPLLTREEKCAFSSGLDTWHTKPVPRLGIPSILFHDGPHGLRKQPDASDALGLNESVPATCFPTAAISACSFDRELLWQLGAALGKEALLQEIDVVLGPGINIKRSPLCGRNFEYFSEDPLLSGELAAAYVQGMQAQGVGASVKHFVANNQEFCRLINNSQVDERALREIYLKAFEIVVRQAQPWTIMPAYNRINGSYACQNKTLLTDIARDEWGFEGLFVSDWGAVEDRVKAVQAGLDLEMPSSAGYRDQQLLKALQAGQTEEGFIDRAVSNLLALIQKCQAPKSKPSEATYLENHELARKVLTQSAVLLKNDSSLLPLSSEVDVLIVGELATKPHYQGSGSSRVNPTRLVSLTQAVEARGMSWQYLPGYKNNSEVQDAALLSEACSAAQSKAAVIVVAGLTEDDEAEGYDRTRLALHPSQNKLIQALAEVNSNVVVVLLGGGVMTLPWLDQVSSVLFVGLAGQAFGEGCLDLLLGDVNPSGKLSESWPFSLNDVPSSASYAKRYNTAYLESIFVGYRYYATAGKSVCFPFGHGLSYTSFAVSDPQISAACLRPGETLTLKVKLSNTGNQAGKEVLQVYISPPQSTVFKAARELKAFEKIALASSQSKEVEFKLSYDDFAYWNTETHHWQVEPGIYEILIGTSSTALPLSVVVEVESEHTPVSLPDYRQVAPQYYELPINPTDFSQEQFENLPGSVKVSPPVLSPGNFDLNSTLWEAQHTWHGRLILKGALKMGERVVGKSTDISGNTRRTVEASTIDAPLRSFIMGGIPLSVSIGICHLLNKQFLKGFWCLLKGLLTGQ